MNALEQEIQCTLFVRTNRGVQLTPEGQQLYVRVSAAMTQLQAAEDELTKSASLEYGSISIGASEIALNIYLLHRLRQFHIDYPKVRLKIANHSTPQAIQSLKSGEIDFAVVTTPLNRYIGIAASENKGLRLPVLLPGCTFHTWHGSL